jgi:twinkle protein
MTTNLQIGPVGEVFLDERRIDVELANRAGLYTGNFRNGVMVPDAYGSWLVYPFLEHGVVVNEKYRNLREKKFLQKKDGKKTFWNHDAFDDPLITGGGAKLIITEGENDALAAMTCGFPLTVSVPDGAPPPAADDEDAGADYQPIHDRTGKFEYCWNNRHAIKAAHEFVLAVDGDPAGQRLATELVLRIGAARCYFVEYPDGCKDLNDVLMRYGPETVTKVLNAAKPYPVRGLYEFSDYPEKPQPKTYSTGFADLDDYLKLWLGELLVITGIPGHGKSTMALNMALNMAQRYNWRIALASFEIPTMPHLRNKFRRMLTANADGAADPIWQRERDQMADEIIQRHFVFIDNEMDQLDEDDMTLDWLLDRAADAVQRYGIKMFIIDPWNEIEHARPRDETETQYVNRSLRAIRRFANKYQIIAVVLAHPTKAVASDGGKVPSLYDIEGSASWYNKPDHGVVIDVPNSENGEAVFHIKKVRFGWTGKKGIVTLNYDPATETYSSLGGMTPRWKVNEDLKNDAKKPR